MISHLATLILFFMDFFFPLKAHVFFKIYIMLKKMYFMLNLCTHVQNNDFKVGFFKMKKWIEINKLLPNYPFNLELLKSITFFLANGFMGPFFSLFFGPFNLALPTLKNIHN